MTKTPDFAKAIQDMMANFPVDTSSLQDTFKTQSMLAERMTRVALSAAERSTEISAQWAKDTLSRVGELAASKDDPSDYAKAATDFASAASELAAEHMAAFAEIAKKVQMETVDLMLSAGKDLGESAQDAVQKTAEKARAATKTTKG